MSKSHAYGLRLCAVIMSFHLKASFRSTPFDATVPVLRPVT